MVDALVERNVFLNLFQKLLNDLKIPRFLDLIYDRDGARRSRDHKMERRALWVFEGLGVVAFVELYFVDLSVILMRVDRVVEKLGFERSSTRDILYLLLS